MSFFRQLFAKPVKVFDLKLRCTELNRVRTHAQQEIRKLEIRRNNCVEEIKQARKINDSFGVNNLWDELKSVRAEITISNKDIRRMNLEVIGLKKYTRALTRLEQVNDTTTIRELFKRIHNSSLDSKLAMSDAKEQDYLDELAVILESVGAEADTTLDEHDPEKDKFLAKLDAVIVAEELGDSETASKNEELLKAEIAQESKDFA